MVAERTWQGAWSASERHAGGWAWHALDGETAYAYSAYSSYQASAHVHINFLLALQVVLRVLTRDPS